MGQLAQEGGAARQGAASMRQEVRAALARERRLLRPHVGVPPIDLPCVIAAGVAAWLLSSRPMPHLLLIPGVMIPGWGTTLALALLGLAALVIPVVRALRTSQFSR